jgi:hypothetical protein
VIKRLLLAVCLLWIPAAVTAEDSLPSFRAGGLLFGDFYTVPSHHSEEGDGASGFVLRRRYPPYTADYTENPIDRLRLEVNETG